MHQEAVLLELMRVVDLHLARLGDDVQPGVGDHLCGVFTDFLLGVDAEEPGVRVVDVDNTAFVVRDDDSDLQAVDDVLEESHPRDGGIGRDGAGVHVTPPTVHSDRHVSIMRQLSPLYTSTLTAIKTIPRDRAIRGNHKGICLSVHLGCILPAGPVFMVRKSQ